MGRRIAKTIMGLEVFIVDDIPKTLEYLETKNINRRKGYYAHHLQNEASAFLEELEKTEGFTREWGISTCLMKPDLVRLPDKTFLEGYLFVVKAGPTLYDCGESHEQYLKRMNIRAWFIETGLGGEVLAIVKVKISPTDVN